MISPETHRRLSLRISVTRRCQLRCVYCRPSGRRWVPPHRVLTPTEILSFVRAIKSRFGVSKVHLTGGEPLLRADLPRLIGTLAREGIPDIALTTNGQLLLHTAGRLKEAGLDRVNISVDSLDPHIFRQLTGGELALTLSGLDAALSCGLSPVKLNVLVIKDVNDHELVQIARFGLARGCEVRFLELMPVGAAATHFRRWFVSSSEVRAALSGAFALTPLRIPAGSSVRGYAADDGNGPQGVIGFISSHTKPFCSGCTRLRLTADGRLLGCLARKEAIRITSLLRSCEVDPVARARLLCAVEAALQLKRKKRMFRAQHIMAAIGG